MWTRRVQDRQREQRSGQYVRMMVKVLSPSVDHAKKPDVRTQMFRDAGEYEQTRCTRSEQQIVQQTLLLQS